MPAAIPRRSTAAIMRMAFLRSKSMPALRRGHGDVAYRSNPSQAKRLWHWPRLESSSHRLRLARDDGEVRTRGLIRLGLALFPIPERAEGDTKASRKLLLRKTKRAAHHLDLRDALEVRGPLRRQRRVVRIVQRRRVDFLLRHGIQRCPISPFGRKRPRRSVGKPLDEGSVREALATIVVPFLIAGRMARGIARDGVSSPIVRRSPDGA